MNPDEFGQTDWGRIAHVDIARELISFGHDRDGEITFSFESLEREVLPRLGAPVRGTIQDKIDTARYFGKATSGMVTPGGSPFEFRPRPGSSRPGRGSLAYGDEYPPFGVLQDADFRTRSATFRVTEPFPSETTITAEMVDTVVGALAAAGVIHEDAPKAIREALAGRFQKPEVLTPDKALTLIVETVKHAPQAHRATMAREWLVKTSAAMTEILKQELEDDDE